MATVPESPVVTGKNNQRQIVVSARITEEQLHALNVHLKVDGYENIGQLLRDYAYKFPRYSMDRQCSVFFWRRWRRRRCRTPVREIVYIRIVTYVCRLTSI
jgi:hypothetical protein